MSLYLKRVMSLRNFRLLFISTVISMLGSQFTLIAMPWLILQLTGDPLALGIVLALEGLPKALFTLIGGALCDRFQPGRVMFVTDIICCALIGLVASMLLSGVMSLSLLYFFALSFGATSGLAIPATNSLVPLLVDEQDLEAGNSLIMGMTQLATLIGPILAGILIGNFSTNSHSFELAFSADAISFLVSAILIWNIRKQQQVQKSLPANESIFSSIGIGIKYLWSDKTLRFLSLLLSTLNFLLIGPLIIGIPLLAEHRLSGGASDFGLLMSAFAGGSLIGFLCAGCLKRPNEKIIRFILIMFVISFGLITAFLGFIFSSWIDILFLLLVGAGNGYLTILLLTWMQNHSPKDMLGRVMSLLMFSNASFVAASQLLAGYICQWNLNFMFLSAGVAVIILGIFISFRQELFNLSSTLSLTGNKNAST